MVHHDGRRRLFRLNLVRVRQCDANVLGVEDRKQLGLVLNGLGNMTYALKAYGSKIASAEILFPSGFAATWSLS